MLRDPTLKAHFSNLAGRAFADFLGREIEQAWVTFSYEGMLLQSGTQVIGARPDLLAVNPFRVVALEAKGYAKRSVSATEMELHKQQAQKGTLTRHSSAASVAYALYDRVRVNYLDPEDDHTTPEPESTRRQLRDYFDGVIQTGEVMGRQRACTRASAVLDRSLTGRHSRPRPAGCRRFKYAQSCRTCYRKGRFSETFDSGSTRAT